MKRRLSLEVRPAETVFLHAGAVRLNLFLPPIGGTQSRSQKTFYKIIKI
jgi:hypothetical protein